MRLIFATLFGFLCWSLVLPAPAMASRCIAFVDRGPDTPAKRPPVVPAGFSLAQQSRAQNAGEVKITYIDHSTFRLRTPSAVVIATDYAGYAGEGPVPMVVTMNHAHETHYTDFPDPAIEHVLRGWNPKGGPAEHRLTVRDTLIRNVSTDIRTWNHDIIEKDGNSIFIFEVADLCIGHLGHLHHKPSPQQLARIGRLDVVFAPVDGTYTLDLPAMIEVLKALRASLVIPMHYFAGDSLEVFLGGMSKEFAIRRQKEKSTVVSLKTLPDRPTVLVLPGF